MAAQVFDAGRWLLQQMHSGADHFAQVVRRNVGGQAHGNAGSAIQQHVGQACRQPLWLFQRAVKVRHPVHCAQRQLLQQRFGIRRQARFGVAHGGK